MDPQEPEAPTFVGQLRVGNFNTPLYRLTVFSDRLELRYRTTKDLAADEVEVVRPVRLPIIGWFMASGVRFTHHSPEFHERLIFNTLRSASLLDALEAAGYRVER